MKTDLTVAGYAIHDNKVLLIHHRKLDLWLPVGGHIDPNETPDGALIREFKEETNLDIKIPKHEIAEKEGNIIENLATPFYVNKHSVGDHHHVCFYYVCTVKDPNATINKELKDSQWFSKEELEQAHIKPEVRKAAQHALQIQALSELKCCDMH